MERTVVDGRYVLSGLLGGGGMGRVYLARDEVLERDVALKVLREQYTEDEEFVERFEREARAAASLNYPNIISVYDRGLTADGTYYIAMEYVTGGTLKDRILGEGPLEASEAVRLASQVADALGVAHASGIIHRDVKPHNVLLTADGNAKVADFGVARAARDIPLSNSSLVLGTVKYMSPEQATGDPLGPESDLYSLGVVLYEMLTGEVPFEADSAIGVAMKHVNETPKPPSEKNPAVPEALDAVTMKLLEKKPEDRYPGAAELVADLSRIGEGLSPVFTVPSGLTEVGSTGPLAAPTVPGRGLPAGMRRDFSRSRTMRRRAILLLAAVVLLALLVLAGFGVMRGSGGQVLGTLGGAGEQAAGVEKVPGVIGLTEAEARERLADQGFDVTVERRASAEEDEGRVLEQSAPAGEEARRDSRITLVVGGGPRTIEAPDLVGLTPEKAEVELEQAGLELGERKEAPSERVPTGEVSAQDPEVGTKAEAGTEVDLTISSGPPATGEPDRVEVPDVSGLGLEQAVTLLEQAGCEVAGTREEPSEQPVGTVIGTDPSIGTAITSRTPVILIISGGSGSPTGDPVQPAPSPSASASPDASAAPETPPEVPPTDPDSSAPPETPAEPAPSSPAPPANSPEPSSPAPSSPPPASSAPPAEPAAPTEPAPAESAPAEPATSSTAAPSSAAPALPGGVEAGDGAEEGTG